jgi:hypothetical protein
MIGVMIKYILLISLLVLVDCKKVEPFMSGRYTCYNVGSGYPNSYAFNGDSLTAEGRVSKVTYPASNKIIIEGETFTLVKNPNNNPYSIYFQLDEKQDSPEDLGCGNELSKEEFEKLREKIDKGLNSQM